MKKRIAVVVLIVLMMIPLGCIKKKPITTMPVKSSSTELVPYLVSDLLSSIGPRRGLCIAVLGFSSSKSDRQLSSYLTDRLTNAFFKKGLRVVDRIHLSKARKEIMLSQDGTISKETAQNIGEVFGANVLIVGTIYYIGGRTEVVCRAIRTENNTVVASSEVVLARKIMAK